ncbi:CubicO group peptidase (beta-lactamase class C family) [Leucobacter luti]|uniref:serine hydrolase domain-containing protein n=1 Tax=Leucobacter luti TaxID=340320 RepID=UPI0010436B8D|nr:serine hydrolase domain-containing protein [Leucobacter luti]MCW2289915.1 CubicO group peptidase (beta-lactamase class C family) [Leucobacter luti]TCK36084.1 CubicO group peptidase (beta-lactamase class C family) [Leucobacter luti]
MNPVPQHGTPRTLTTPSELPGSTRVSALLKHLCENAPVAGGTLAVATPHGAVAYAFGSRGAHGGPVTVGDRFEIGSISKTVAALAAARLAVTGQWSLDDHVCDLLPWLRLPAEAGNPSIRHLLTHTTGWITGNDALPGEAGQAWGLASTRAGSPPGAFFHYSNIGYVVLGLAIAEATGTPFHRAVRELVLDPLGMSGTLAQVTGAERESIVPGTVPSRDDAPWTPGDSLADAAWVEPAGADGNVAANVSELLAFAVHLTDPTATPEAEWLPAAVALLSRERAPGGEDVLAAGRHLPVVAARYGLGVNVEETAEGTLLTHGGGMIGYGSFMISDSASGIAVAVLLSAPGERPYAELLAREVHASAVLDAANAINVEAPVLSAGQLDPVASLLPVRSPLQPGTDELAGITGCFRSYSPWFPHLELGVDGAGTLVLRAYAGVEAPTADVPLVRLPGHRLRFRIGADPRLPETIECDAIIDGIVHVLDRDGCRYSRVAAR